MNKKRRKAPLIFISYLWVFEICPAAPCQCQSNSVKSICGIHIKRKQGAYYPSSESFLNCWKERIPDKHIEWNAFEWKVAKGSLLLAILNVYMQYFCRSQPHTQSMQILWVERERARGWVKTERKLLKNTKTTNAFSIFITTTAFSNHVVVTLNGR